MKIEFMVKDQPPKKDGANSMWRKKSEVQHIVALRTAALEAKKKANLQDYLSSYVALNLTIFIPLSKIESIGDLDNFVSGVCDGLQADRSKEAIHEVFLVSGREDISPKHPMLIADDKKVLKIVANKVPIREGQSTHYKIILETLETTELNVATM